jgi:hypothetical protein
LSSTIRRHMGRKIVHHLAISDSPTEKNLNYPRLSEWRDGGRVMFNLALCGQLAALTACSTACRSEVTTQSARVVASAPRSTTSCAVNVQSPTTIVAWGSRRRNRRTR